MLAEKLQSYKIDIEKNMHFTLGTYRDLKTGAIKAKRVCACILYSPEFNKIGFSLSKLVPMSGQAKCFSFFFYKI
jgi:hypothetical protein